MKYLFFTAVCVCLQLLWPQGTPANHRNPYFDRTCNNITATFAKFQKCNAGTLSHAICDRDFASQYFLFDNVTTVEQLRNYHFILLPGGDYDFFSSLVLQCDGGQPQDLASFYKYYPRIADGIMTAIDKNVCPDYLQGVETYYDRFMGAFTEYEKFFIRYKIPYTRLQFSEARYAMFVGDRAAKVNLLAATINAMESAPDENGAAPKKYILIGHSFGGLNIIDFLMELLNAHVYSTPESRLFRDTAVRSWPAEKKRLVYGKIKGVVLLNSFIQGLLRPEDLIEKIAAEQAVQTDDALQHYINRVLQSSSTDNFDEDNDTRNQIYHFVLRSNLYRSSYYLQDKNSAEGKIGSPIQNAIARIADEKAVLAAGCSVPRIVPMLLVQPNILVYLSKKLWRQDQELNDGMVTTYSTILPGKNVEFVLFTNLDHGALVLKPEVRGISIAYKYEQTPFIQTLLARLMTKIDEIPCADN